MPSYVLTSKYTDMRGAALSGQVSHEHLPRLVSDHELGLCFPSDGLGRHAARPEDGNVIGGRCHGLAIVGRIQVRDTNCFRIPNVNWNAVGVGIASRKFQDKRELIGRDRSVSDNNWPAESSGRDTPEGGDKHRHGGARLNMTKNDPRFIQGMLKRVAAP